MTLPRTWIRTTVIGPAPVARAASTKSRSRTWVVALSETRTIGGIGTIVRASRVLGVPGPSAPATASASRIDVPVLRLDEALHPGGHGARRDVVGDEQEERLVHVDLVQPADRRELLGLVEGVADLVDRRVDLRVGEVTPVGALGRDEATVDVAHQGGERVLAEVGRVGRGRPVGRGILGPGAPVGEQRVPIAHVEFDVDADLGEVLPDRLVHRHQLHLTRAGGRDDRLHGDRLVLGDSRLDHQLPGGGEIGLHLEGGLAEPRARGRHHALAGCIMPPSSSFMPLTVDREVGGLADADVTPGRSLEHRDVPRPDVRIDVRGDLEAGAPQAVERIRRRRLDPVDLSGA